MATLTYVYADQTAVLGPLATSAEPHTYDLCAEHSQRLSAPNGWSVLRSKPASKSIVTPSGSTAGLKHRIESHVVLLPGAASPPALNVP